MKRKKSILQRERTLQRQGLPSKKQKRDVQRQEQGAGPLAGGGQRQHTAGGNKKQHKAPQGLRPTSAVHAQAAYAVQRLLEADASKRGGVTLKGLTLAPHITAKKARPDRHLETWCSLCIVHRVIVHRDALSAAVE